MDEDPHRACEVAHAGAPLREARLVVLAAHGRYAAPGQVLRLHGDMGVAGEGLADVAWLAPAANGGSWWGETFLAPLLQNEPGLSSALARVSALVNGLAEQGFGPGRIVLLGYSQGACLVLEYAARNPASWRGIVAMSGGLMGTGEGDGCADPALLGHTPKRFEYEGELRGVPVHIGCHASDPVIPIARVEKTANVLRAMKADVDLRIVPGRRHGITGEDKAALKDILAPRATG